MSFKVLIVEKNTARAEHLSSVLESAEHDVLPLSDLKDASEALTIQHFDAVLVPASSSGSELQTFADQLRRLSRTGGHTALLACGASGGVPDVDGVLPYDFGAQAFAAEMSKLSRRVADPEGTPTKPAESEPIFNESEFREQMCDDGELMVEIIDLYLSESAKQRKQMGAALDAGDLTALSRLAHTIKGSLASLHTPRARACAQTVELAARSGKGPESASALVALEAELTALEPVLIAFRNR